MKKWQRWLNRRYFIYGLAVLLVICLYFFKLNTLTRGFSSSELANIRQPLGWRGLYHQPLYLPLKIIRSIDFKSFSHHGLFLGRLPNVLFGLLSCLFFYLLLRLWHNERVAALGTFLFVTSAWVLHVSRLASYDVLYLFGSVSLALLYATSQKAATNRLGYYGRIILIDLLLFIPGLIWLVLLTLGLSKASVKKSWQTFNGWSERLVGGILLILPWPLLGLNFRFKGTLLAWLGLPLKWPGLSHLAKNIGAVLVHLFIRGPLYSNVWLGKAPIFNIFVLGTAILGAVFYLSRWPAQRSQFLGLYFVLACLLVAVSGPVSLSLLVPIVLILSTTGMAYLLHEWFKVFPANPLARSVGLSLIIFAILISGFYGLKAYFVAWPHNPTTASLFRYRK